MNPLDLFPGWKTYIAAVGLIGLGVYQLSTGAVTEGVASILAGIALIANRRAVDRPA